MVLQDCKPHHWSSHLQQAKLKNVICTLFYIFTFIESVCLFFIFEKPSLKIILLEHISLFSHSLSLEILFFFLTHLERLLEHCCEFINMVSVNFLIVCVDTHCERETLLSISSTDNLGCESIYGQYTVISPAGVYWRGAPEFLFNQTTNTQQIQFIWPGS